ncbi:MAG: recombinase family protein [Planktomarina sp.]
MKKVRCAIYTRKSSEDGLEQEFNSLDAQREACEAYIASQKHEGWTLIPTAYDDGGLSGGSLERPALKRLMDDLAQGHVDQIIVYKIDRLTRSLGDFSKIVDVLDAAGASFVSVTQSFNTATSMGRLTLNMLLSFAQFEREVTAERIRDKIAASKRKGLWMGGNVPLGYKPDGRTLSICETDAATVRTLYQLYTTHRNIRIVKREADKQGLRTAVRTLLCGRMKGGTAFSFGHLHHILTNPIYAGRIRHKKNVYPGQHPALIDPEAWDALQIMLAEASATPRNKERDTTQRSLLVGKVFDETGDRLTPSHTKTGKGRRLRYYVSHRLIRGQGRKDPTGWRLPGPDFEYMVQSVVHNHLAQPMVQAGLVETATVGEIDRITKALGILLRDKPGIEAKIKGRDEASGLKDACPTSTNILPDMIEKVNIAQGTIQITLAAEAIGMLLNVPVSRITEDQLSITSEFQHRKRGVETKLVLADAPALRDEVLFKNIALAHRYFDMIVAGMTYAEIATVQSTSKRRVQQIVELAFLAPDIIRKVWEGTQPVGLTSNWLKSHAVPAFWDQQRDLFKTL